MTKSEFEKAMREVLGLPCEMSDEQFDAVVEVESYVKGNAGCGVDHDPISIARFILSPGGFDLFRVFYGRNGGLS